MQTVHIHMQQQRRLLGAPAPVAHQAREASRLRQVLVRHRVQAPSRVSHAQPRRSEALQVLAMRLRVRQHEHAALARQIPCQVGAVLVSGVHLLDQVLSQFEVPCGQVQSCSRAYCRSGCSCCCRCRSLLFAIHLLVRFLKRLVFVWHSRFKEDQDWQETLAH